MGGGLASWPLVVQGGSAGPGVVAKESHSEKPSLSWPANEEIMSTIHL